MKSLFLTGIERPALLRSALSQVLPAHGETFLLASPAGDPIAYLSIVCESEAMEVQADISGRHYHEEDAVVAVLNRIGAIVGGSVKNEDSA